MKRVEYERGCYAGRWHRPGLVGTLVADSLEDARALDTFGAKADLVAGRVFVCGTRRAGELLESSPGAPWFERIGRGSTLPSPTRREIRPRTRRATGIVVAQSIHYSPVNFRSPPTVISPTDMCTGNGVPSRRRPATSRPMPMIFWTPVARWRARYVSCAPRDTARASIC
jgi:hypothetical protein